ncbi:phytanoyl-CoA dioxygenase family protein [Prauserella oleivorans]|uniref:Phytanoyl-CoA dioxygenase family protein n=1 Tax=Prauserella oleivorans TaxID=1478153 RepID=A0ABW5W3V7_9PSEU
MARRPDLRPFGLAPDLQRLDRAGRRARRTRLPDLPARLAPLRRPGPGGVVRAHRRPGQLPVHRWPELRWSPRVTVPLRAGDATLHQGRTAHYVGANTSDEARLSFLVAFTDPDATYRRCPAMTRSACDPAIPSRTTATLEHPDEPAPDDAQPEHGER